MRPTWRTRPVVWAMGLVGVPALAAAIAIPASADHASAGGPALRAPIVASVPTDPAIFGYGPGGKPWVIRAGHVALWSTGQLAAQVSGLVVPPPTGTGVNPLPSLAAFVFCNGALVATTPSVPFAANGNARIHAMVTLPAICPAPAVLLGPPPAAGSPNVYIAFDGSPAPMPTGQHRDPGNHGHHGNQPGGGSH